jgi:hypothetical protein
VPRFIYFDVENLEMFSGGFERETERRERDREVVLVHLAQ